MLYAKPSQRARSALGSRSPQGSKPRSQSPVGAKVSPVTDHLPAVRTEKFLDKRCDEI